MNTSQSRGRMMAGGDVDIAAIKRRFGERVALKGNVRTSGPLLDGTPAEVEQEVIETLRAAAIGGGFILSTGDQVGGNTPMANLERMIEAGRRYGRYDENGNLPDLPYRSEVRGPKSDRMGTWDPSV